MNIEQEKLFRFGNLELLAKSVVEGFITGLHKSPFHGFSVEFAEHRLYNKGESTKHIDWKLFARTDKLFQKRYEEETNLRCRIAIDCSSSMYLPKGAELNKFEFATIAAASLMELLRRQRDAVSLELFGSDNHFVSQTKSSSTHIQSLYRELEKQSQSQAINQVAELSSTIHQIADRIHRRSLVILFSDMFLNFEGDIESKKNELLESLRHLKHAKHEVILFQVYTAKEERDFDFGNRPYHFIDVESGKEIKVQSNEIKDLYLEKIKSYREQIILECGKLGIDFVDSAIEDGFHKILSTFMVRRQRMY